LFGKVVFTAYLAVPAIQPLRGAKAEEGGFYFVVQQDKPPQVVVCISGTGVELLVFVSIQQGATIRSIQRSTFDIDMDVQAASGGAATTNQSKPVANLGDVFNEQVTVGGIGVDFKPFPADGAVRHHTVFPLVKDFVHYFGVFTIVDVDFHLYREMAAKGVLFEFAFSEYPREHLELALTKWYAFGVTTAAVVATPASGNFHTSTGVYPGDMDVLTPRSTSTRNADCAGAVGYAVSAITAELLSGYAVPWGEGTNVAFTVFIALTTVVAPVIPAALLSQINAAALVYALKALAALSRAVPAIVAGSFILSGVTVFFVNVSALAPLTSPAAATTATIPANIAQGEVCFLYAARTFGADTVFGTSITSTAHLLLRL
jgi:hypothetical protein